MRERDYTYHFRPVPLIQRDGVSTLGERSRTGDTARRREPATMQREPVSAYLGESEVVSVTRRSERRVRRSSSARLSLVPEDRPATRTRRSGSRANDERSTVERVSRRSTTLGASAYSGYDSPSFVSYERPSEDRARQEASAHRPRRTRNERRPAGRRRRNDGLIHAAPRAVSGLFGAAVHHVGFTTVIVVLVFTTAMLFTPIRNLYLAHRQLDTLEATYAALEAENESIRNELSVLQTREGIENEARERGYVSQGETKVVVDGVPQPEAEDATQAIAPITLPDERPWYVRFLDALFGYDPEA